MSVDLVARALATRAGEGAAGKSAYEIAVQNGYLGTQAQWIASLHGEDGSSAYALAVQDGFGGTRSEWLASLVGPPGQAADPQALAALQDGLQAALARIAALEAALGPPIVQLTLEALGAGTTPIAIPQLADVPEGNVVTLTIPADYAADFLVPVSALPE